MVATTANSVTLKEVRAWCRAKYGATWHECEPQVKKARKREARKALNQKAVKPTATCTKEFKEEFKMALFKAGLALNCRAAAKVLAEKGIKNAPTEQELLDLILAKLT